MGVSIHHLRKTNPWRMNGVDVDLEATIGIGTTLYFPLSEEEKYLDSSLFLILLWTHFWASFILYCMFLFGPNFSFYK